MRVELRKVALLDEVVHRFKDELDRHRPLFASRARAEKSEERARSQADLEAELRHQERVAGVMAGAGFANASFGSGYS